MGATPEELEALPEALRDANTICQIANSIGKIDTDLLDATCNRAYKTLLTKFPFAKVKATIHWSLAHLAELIKLNDGYSIGELFINFFKFQVFIFFSMY